MLYFRWADVFTTLKWLGPRYTEHCHEGRSSFFTIVRGVLRRRNNSRLREPQSASERASHKSCETGYSPLNPHQLRRRRCLSRGGPIPNVCDCLWDGSDSCRSVCPLPAAPEISRHVRLQVPPACLFFLFRSQRHRLRRSPGSNSVGTCRVAGQPAGVESRP
jgi:hypothetical protein